MDGFNEKKWFVYISDHHEGPFSLAELQAKLEERQLTTASFVWCEGMPDWKSMAEVPECESILGKPGAAAPPFNGPSVTLMPGEPSAPAPAAAEEPAPAAELSSPGLLLSGASAMSQPQADAEKVEEEISHVQLERTISGGAPASFASPMEPVEAAQRSKGGAGKFLFLAFLLVAVGGLGYAATQGYLDPYLKSPGAQAAIGSARDFALPYAQKLADRIPALGRWISPLPSLTDIQPAEYEALKNAARTPANPANLAVGLALSTAQPEAPAFYVSSSLPDGAEFDIYVIGVPETLMNQLSFQQKVHVKLQKRLGKSEPVRLGTSDIPRGQYEVTVMESEAQQPDVSVLLTNFQGTGIPVAAELPKGRKLVALKKYFLGGAEDEIYKSRLKQFHDDLRKKAETELSEVNQFAVTLENELTSTMSQFAQLRKVRKLTPVHKRNWEAFHKKWTDFSSKRASTFEQWTPEKLSAEYFYGPLYKLTRDAGYAVERAHDVHNQFFTGKVLPKAFDIQRDETEASAQGALNVLRAKIGQAQKMAAASVIPQREGL